MRFGAADSGLTGFWRSQEAWTKIRKRPKTISVTAMILATRALGAGAAGQQPDRLRERFPPDGALYRNYPTAILHPPAPPEAPCSWWITRYSEVIISLGGHLKSGHRRSLQNRPTINRDPGHGLLPFLASLSKFIQRRICTSLFSKRCDSRIIVSRQRFCDRLRRILLQLPLARQFHVHFR